MGQQQFLIDSNVVIDYLSGKLPEFGMNFMHGVINDVPKLSVITKIEVLGFSAPESHYKLLQEFVDVSVIIPVTDEVASRTILIRKAKKIKTPDAIIAATALQFDLTLITRNITDFNAIEGLNVLNPYDESKLGEF